MADWAAENVRPVLEKKRAVQDIPQHERQLFTDVFRRFVEIQETVEHIDLCLEMLRTRVRGRKSVRLDQWLTYHLTFYLQEVYILRERLVTYCKVIPRRMKRAGCTVNQARFDRLLEAIEATFKSICDARSCHVHGSRFCDEQLDRVSSLCLIASFRPDFVEDAQWEYLAARKKWVAQLIENRKGIATLLDAVFDALYEEVREASPALLANYAFKRAERGSEAF